MLRSSPAAPAAQAFSGKGDEWYTVSTVAADPPGFGTITTAAHSSAATGAHGSRGGLVAMQCDASASLDPALASPP